MEGSIVSIFTWMGFISLYLVIMTLTMRYIYLSLKNCKDEEGRIILTIFGGLLFPVVIPFGILVYWVYTIMSIPLGTFDEKESKPKDNGNEVSKLDSKSKFKVGDIVTGVKGNPGNYKCLYEGCVCRVLKLYKNRPSVDVILVDHKDKEAHNHRFGNTFDVPIKNFTLVKKPATKKKKKG